MEDFVDRTKIISAADLETGLSGLFFARNAQCVARSPDDQRRLQVSWKSRQRFGGSPLTETVQFEDFVRINRGAKLVLGVAIAVVCIRMVHLETLLIAGPDFLRRCIFRQTKRLKRLGFKDFEFATLQIRSLRLSGRSALAGVHGLCGTGPLRAGEWNFGRLGRTNAGRLAAAFRRFTLIARRDGVGEVRREIITLVIFPNVLGTKQQVQAFTVAANGRTQRAALVAAIPLAFRPIGFTLRNRFFAGRPQPYEYL